MKQWQKGICVLPFAFLFTSGLALADQTIIFEQGMNGYEGNAAISIDSENPADDDLADSKFVTRYRLGK